MATLNGIDKGYEFLANQLPATPILSSWTIDGMVGCKISFKSEHLQKTGSFKTRGALHNMRILAEKESKGVITHSSGNHGQAVAWAAHQFSIPCTVVVPENTPAAKIDAIEGYRARVVRCGNGIVDREETCDRLAKELSLDIIQPFDTVETIEGQGSLGLELRSQLGEIESLFVSVGGGGLAAGLALALPDTTLYLVEPQGKELRMQLDGSHNDDQSALDTIADGIRVRIIGDENKRILANHPKVHIITVSEEEIREALILIWTRLKQHVEPTAAVAFAGLRQVQMAASSPLPFSSTTVILCGGNIDTSFIP
ncbi:hypothetical protein PENTCL1PPCAC_15906 [Pristionchus entomophagus]|uniref:Serine racemase n=1 Tax=Pristionchus entomophagus TaxID=358040 RepID=A0AAV5THD0_9BILA|nr:hypothetical protein PENTCL1PPCAC_15906 [Pristionchus entomophagus]